VAVPTVSCCSIDAVSLTDVLASNPVETGGVPKWQREEKWKGDEENGTSEEHQQAILSSSPQCGALQNDV